MSISSRRMTPDESRLAALEAARAILIESGPQAVTLKAVAARMGRTHANLLHHFGSALGLQRALSGYLADSVCDKIAAHMRQNIPHGWDVAQVVNRVFDAFVTDGGGVLVSWLLMTGHDDALEPVIEAIMRVIDEVAVTPEMSQMLREDAMAVMLMALGDALLGEYLGSKLQLPRPLPRTLATAMIETRIRAMQAERTA